jgi:hypothetical protein
MNETEATNVINPENKAEKLTTGDVLLISAKQTKDYTNTSMVTLEWAEKMPSSATGRRKITAVQLLNTSNEKFSSGAQRCWESYTTADLKEFLGLDTSPNSKAWYIDTSKDGESIMRMDLGILNPATIVNDEICFWKMEINESTEPDAYQAENAEATCKTAGKGGTPITHEGQLVWRNTEMILFQPSDSETEAIHTYLKSDPRKATIQVLEEEELDFEDSMISSEVDEATPELAE